MNIAVFGDSYARTFDNYKGSDSLGKAWWELLANRYNLSNFGLAGSSAYYSIEQFNQYHANYNKVIFFMTFPGRVYLQEHNRISTPGFPARISRNFNSYDSTVSALNLLRTMPDYSKLDEKRLLCMMDYFLYVSNLEEEDFKIKLYTEYIKRTRPDALIISCYDMVDIANIEMSHWGIQDDAMRRSHLEIRKCHLSNENNVIFSNIIDQWITTGVFDLRKDKFVTPADPWQLYFKSYSV